MRPRWLLVVATLATLAGCHDPSPAYREASDLYDRIRAEETAQGLLVPDFRDDRWEKVTDLLAQVPESSAEHLAARLLLAQVKPARDKMREGKANQCQWGCQTRLEVCGAGCGCVVAKALMGSMSATCYTDNPNLQGQPIRNHPCLGRCEKEYNDCTRACPGLSR